MHAYCDSALVEQPCNGTHTMGLWKPCVTHAVVPGRTRIELAVLRADEANAFGRSSAVQFLCGLHFHTKSELEKLCYQGSGPDTFSLGLMVVTASRNRRSI